MQNKTFRRDLSIIFFTKKVNRNDHEKKKLFKTVEKEL